ncbi:hypothetical protein CI109_100150 [Kwoniella shandongensis]|uniref:Uncharacterized protein n=1 Tax=Kwoniella shandongensis TaxID=1734106 RepID=A0A5M6BST3_9TREE|nr:uncharacterized protein CI109_005748 [Kwoniella shandongensis]KAA5525867.1 hypothetical protein CI109_005748 [Kwoniella shandongensis]
MLRSIRAKLASTDTTSRPSPGEYQALAVSVGDEATSPEQEFALKERRNDWRVYLCFWALGAGVLMSWNALICTFPLLISFFPPESSARSSLASVLATSYCFGNLFFLGLAQRQVGQTPPSARLRWSLLLILITSLVLTFPLLPLIFPTLPPSILFPALIATTIILSLSTAYLQSSVFALSSLWGSNQVIAVMSGQGGIAVLVSGVQSFLAILSATSSSSPPRGGNEEEQVSKLAGVGLWALGSIGIVGCLFAHNYLVKHPEYEAVLNPAIASPQDEDLTLGVGAVVGKEESKTRKVFRKNALLETAVAWVFVVTLSVFPPVTTKILSTHHPVPRLLQPDVFIPLHFLIFNIGDYLGRTYLPSISFLLLTSHSHILLASFARTLFVPLLFACNVTPRSIDSVPVINSDLAYFGIILFFGITNGYIGSLCMIVASSPALNPKLEEDEKDVAGTLASFCLVAGLAGGSLSSFAVTWAVNNHL